MSNLDTAMYLSNTDIFKLKPNLHRVMNDMYSATATLPEFILENSTAIECENGVFFLNSSGPTHKLFHVGHRHKLRTEQNKVSFEKFDIDLDLYIQNLLTFFSIYIKDVHLQLNTKLSFKKVYRYPILNKLMPLKLDNNIRIECTITNEKNFFAGKFYIFCEKKGNQYIIKNQDKVHHFFRITLADWIKNFNISEDYIIDYTLPEKEFFENLIVLKMLTI